MVLPLEPFHQIGAVDHLGVQSLEGQEQNGEIGGIGRFDVLVPDVLGTAPNDLLQLLLGSIDPLPAAGLIGILQGSECVAGELGVNGQVDTPLAVAGQPDGKFHVLPTAGNGGDLRFVLLRRENLL